MADKMEARTLGDFSPCPGCSAVDSVDLRHIGTGRLNVESDEQLHIQFAWCMSCNGAWALEPMNIGDFKKLLCEVGLNMDAAAEEMPDPDTYQDVVNELTPVNHLLAEIHKLRAEKSALRPEVSEISFQIEGKLRTHDKLKGDSWKGMNPLDLQALLVRKLGEMMNTSDPEDAMSKCVSMIALTMMLRDRMSEFVPAYKKAQEASK